VKAAAAGAPLRLCAVFLQQLPDGAHGVHKKKFGNKMCLEKKGEAEENGWNETMS
jgi:hypothetical protein